MVLKWAPILLLIYSKTGGWKVDLGHRGASPKPTAPHRPVLQANAWHRPADAGFLEITKNDHDQWYGCIIDMVRSGYIRPISIPNLIKFWKLFYSGMATAVWGAFAEQHDARLQHVSLTSGPSKRNKNENPSKDVPAQIYLFVMWIRIQHLQSKNCLKRKRRIPHPLSSVLRWCDLLSPWHTSVQVSSYLRFQLKWT